MYKFEIQSEDFSRYTDELAKKKPDQPKTKLENDEGSTKSKPKSERLFEVLATKSFDCLSRGIVTFSMVQDNVNLAFLYCNMGRFMRFKAHLFVTDEQ